MEKQVIALLIFGLIMLLPLVVIATETTITEDIVINRSVGLDLTSRKLYMYDFINTARDALSDEHFPTLLKDGKFTDGMGKDYYYKQSLKIGSRKIIFSKSGETIDPQVMIDMGHDESDPLYSYVLTLSNCLDVSSPDVQNKVIELLGKKYYIGRGSSGSTLNLYSIGTEATLYKGESKKIDVGGSEYIVSCDDVSTSTDAIISVNGQRKEVSEGLLYEIDGVHIYIKAIFYITGDGTSSIELRLDSEKLALWDGSSVLKNEKVVLNTEVGIYQCAGESIAEITIAQASRSALHNYIAVGESYTDRVFGTFSLDFDSMTPPLTDTIVIDTDDCMNARATFTSAVAGNEYTLSFATDSDGSCSNSLCNVILATPANKAIHVKEGEEMQIGDLVIIDDGDDGRILKLLSAGEGTSTNDYTVFRDVITGEDYKFNTGIHNHSQRYIGSGFYYVKVGDPTQSTVEDPKVMVTWGEGATYGNVGTEQTLLPWIKLESGYHISFSTLEDIPTSIRDKIPNLPIRGPVVLVVEKKRVGLGEIEGHIIVIPVKTRQINSVIKPSIGEPLFSDANAVFSQLHSPNSHISQAVDGYGTLIEFSKPVISPWTVTISLPVSHREANIFIKTPISVGTNWTTCKDTDDGINYYVIGNTSTSGGFYYSPQCYSGPCRPPGGGGGAMRYPKTDTCDGDVLTEYYCDIVELKSKTFTCPEGCSGGACLEAPQTTCTDSDGGKDYYVKGYVHGIDAEGKEYNNEDFCIDDKLVENYCELNSPYSENFTCLGGCEDGACLKEKCKSDENCTDMLCPMVIGGDKPKCDVDTGECYCGGSCGDGYCDSYEESSETCDRDCNPDCVPEWECTIEPPICPESGKQTKICEDVKCDMKTKEEKVTCVPEQCSGCLRGTKCLPYGHKLKINDILAYCSVDGVFRNQMPIGAKCQNSYECLSDECSNGKCVSTYSLLEKIWNFFKKLFRIFGLAKELEVEGSKNCVIDEDCVVFGETGDCNCGCYNKDNLPSGTGGECFCAAPTDCKCLDDECEGVFGEE